jgi:hypothetical protein
VDVEFSDNQKLRVITMPGAGQGHTVVSDRTSQAFGTTMRGTTGILLHFVRSIPSCGKRVARGVGHRHGDGTSR